MKVCSYCDSAGDFYFKIGSRTYYRCIQCDLIFRSEHQSYKEVVGAYSHNYFGKYSTDQTEGRRDNLFHHILDGIEKKTQIGALLDVGTGCGFFLEAAKRRGWEVEGIEPSTESVEVARRQSDANVFHGTLQDYKGKDQFDVITLINILEYSALPWREIDQARQLLRPGGLVYLRFINGSLHSKIYRFGIKYGLSNRITKFLVFHYYSFTPKFIRRLLADGGFDEIRILNSPLTEGDPNDLFPSQSLATFVKKFIFSTAKCFEAMSGQQLLLGTSLEVTAIKTNEQ
jgi:SAM-dependent methyltransferase